VQSVDHVVVAAHNGSIDPRPLDYVELEGFNQELPARSVVFENEIAPHRCSGPCDAKPSFLAVSVALLQPAVNRIANEPPGMW
jgi:hypothetical protein